MKKIVMLVGALVLCTASFGASEADDTINVTAQVAEHLDVRATDVDFGTVTAGETKESPYQKGSITIDGEMNRNVKVSLVDKDDSELGTLNLVGEIDKNSVLVYTPILKLNNNSGYPIEFKNGTTIVLNNEGAASIDVEGSLNVPSSARSGDHRGTMTVRVEYTN